jgi:glycosyltransferase involved in cell wall biosynthesis
VRIIEIEYLGPPAVGGVEKLVSEVSHRFLRAGHETEIWATELRSFRGPRHLRSFALEGELPVRRFPVRRLPWYLYDPHHLSWRGLAREMEKAAARETVLHVHSFPSHQAETLLAIAEAGTAGVLTPHHDVESLRTYVRLWRGRALLRRLRSGLRACPGLFLSVTTQIERHFWASELGLPEDRVEVIPNGVSVEEFDSIPEGLAEQAHQLWPPGKLHLLFVGRLAREKGVDVLLRAAALSQAGELALLIVGPDAGERGNLQRLVRDYRLGGRVAFVEDLTRQQLCACFRACDLVVLPSRSGENFGIVLLEAMAARKPVIGARTGGIPELIRPGKNGLLVPNESAGSLAEAIDQLAADPTTRHQMGSFGRRMVESFYSWELVAGLYLQLFERALKTGR